MNANAANGTAETTISTQVVRRDTSIIEGVLIDTERYRLALEPTTQDEGWEVAQAAADAGLVASPAEGFARILIGRPLGIPSMASIQGIALIENAKTGLRTACMYAKLKLGLLQSRKNVVEYFRPKELTNEKATWVAKRRGEEEISYTFTIEDARIAGLVGRGDAKTREGVSMNNYDRHPGPMLQWRACGRLADIVGADVLNSLATREDIEDENRQAREERQEMAYAASRGELAAPVAPPQAAPPRDFSSEAAALKQDIADAISTKDKAKQKAVRERFKKLEAEAPLEIVEDTKRFYNMALGKAREGSEAKTSDAPANTQTAAPAAPPSKPRGQWLPPSQRGDAYDGPEGEDPLS